MAKKKNLLDPPPTVTVASEPIQEVPELDLWRARLKALRMNGGWDEESWGPRPEHKRTRVPPRLVAEYRQRVGDKR